MAFLRKIVLPLAATLICFLCYDQTMAGTQEASQAQKALHQTLAQYDRLHQAGTWRLIQSPQVPTVELVKTSQEMESLIRSSVKKFARVSLATNLIAGRFSDYQVTYSTGFGSMAIQRGGAPVAPKKQRLEVCFYAEQEKGQHPGLLYYRTEWQAVMVAAIAWPEKVFAALLYHELGHALAHQQGKPSATAPSNSDSWTEEEVTMHTIEADVLNAVSGGQYYAKITAILRRPGVKSPGEAFLRVTIEDLKEFDRMFESERGGPELASIMVAQHLLTVGFRAIDSSLPQEKRMAAKRSLYRVIRDF